MPNYKKGYAPDNRPEACTPGILKNLEFGRSGKSSSMPEIKREMKELPMERRKFDDLTQVRPA
jgi:hypothetical protein